MLYETTFDWFQEWSFHTGLTVNSSSHTLNTSDFRIAQPEKVYYRDTLRCIQSDVHTLAQFKTFSTCGKSHPQNQLLMCFSSLFNPFLKIKMSSLLSITGTQTIYIYIYIYIHTYIHVYMFSKTIRNVTMCMKHSLEEVTLYEWLQIFWEITFCLKVFSFKLN